MGCASSSTALAATGHQPRPGRPWFRPGRAPPEAWEALEQVIIGKAVGLLSGPGGLASFLRRRQLGARLGGPSLPLDVGVSSDIPAAIRRAVILRDQLPCGDLGGAGGGTGKARPGLPAGPFAAVLVSGAAVGVLRRGGWL